MTLDDVMVEAAGVGLQRHIENREVIDFEARKKRRKLHFERFYTRLTHAGFSILRRTYEADAGP